MLKDYFEVPNKPAIKSGNILSCDFTDHETFIPQPLDYSRGTIATYVDCNGLIKMDGVSDINLVTNGTFETPVDSSQWLNFGSPLVAERSQDQAYEGSFSYHIKSTGGNVGTQASASQFSGDYVVGDIIQVKAYVYPIIASSNYIRSGVSNSDRSITSVVSGLVLNQWNLIEYYAKITTASNNYVTFLTSGAGEFYLDNVSVKKVDVDIPRIDYTTEIGKAKELQKPSLLLEPQATNVFPFSNFYGSGALEVYSNGTQTHTVTNNYSISPDGTKNSIRLQATVGSSSSDRVVLRDLVTAGASTFTFSVYAKSNTDENVTLGFHSGGGTPSTFVATSEWQRFTYTATLTATSNVGVEVRGGQTSNNVDVSLFGYQLEQQPNATSYIPTSGSTVTRNQDLANNAGQLGVFNNEEGVLYAEMASLANSGVQRKLSISDGTNQKVVVLQFTNVNNQLRAFLYNGALQVNMYNVLSKALEFNKIAFKFKQDDFSLYVNGSEVATDPSGTTFSTGDLTQFNFNDGGISDPFHARIREIKVFRRALTDSELQELTNNIV